MLYSCMPSMNAILITYVVPELDVGGCACGCRFVAGCNTSNVHRQLLNVARFVFLLVDVVKYIMRIRQHNVLTSRMGHVEVQCMLLCDLCVLL